MASDVVKGGWSPEEDERLVRGIKIFGTRWAPRRANHPASVPNFRTDGLKSLLLSRAAIVTVCRQHILSLTSPNNSHRMCKTLD